MHKPMMSITTLCKTTARNVCVLMMLSPLLATSCWADLAADATQPSEVNVKPARPNVVIILLDDVGFAASEVFGGAIKTPALAELAGDGVRFNRFHTTGICSPTRASLLTGRDAHRANVGAVMNSASALPGYQGILNPQTATIAAMLQQAGYATGAFGKWHLTPAWETTPAGPFTRWPTSLGFDKFYGFLGGETDQFAPTLYEGTTPLLKVYGANYHVTEDLVDASIAWIDGQRAVQAEQPFFVYLAPGATHAPLQVPVQWITPYRDVFTAGWDAFRISALARQKAQGIVPADTVLTPRPDAIPAWDTLSKDQQKIASEFMALYAGFLTHTDAQIGRLISALKARGEFENTLFFYVVGDNGGSGEGAPSGSINYMGALQGLAENEAQQLAALGTLGDAKSYAQYPSGWAWAMSTPFAWMKQVASHLGGTRVGMVASWPAYTGRADSRLRSQFAHVNDVAPTILEALALPVPEAIAGVPQLAMDGASLLGAMLDANAPEHHRQQFFEVNGNRAIYRDGWMASAFHQRLPWSVGRRQLPTPLEADDWSLYDLSKDFSQSTDLADSHPARLSALQAVFNDSAAKLGILPLRSAMDTMFSHPPPSLRTEQHTYLYRSPMIGITENQAPPVFNRSWQLLATIDAQAPRGVVAAMGGKSAGWSVYFDQAMRPQFRFRSFERGALALSSDESWRNNQTLAVSFSYDGGGYGRGGEFELLIDGNVVDRGRIAVTPPAFFSIDESFDIGADSGSYAGDYPATAEPGYPFVGHLQQVEMSLAAPYKPQMKAK